MTLARAGRQIVVGAVLQPVQARGLLPVMASFGEVRTGTSLKRP